MSKSMLLPIGTILAIAQSKKCSSVADWFGQFTGFSYNADQKVVGEFNRLATHHLHLSKTSEEYQKLFQSLVDVVKLGECAYPPKSGLREHTISFFVRFTRFNFYYRASKPLVIEFNRLVCDPNWPYWKSEFGIGQKPWTVLTTQIETAMRSDLEKINVGQKINPKISPAPVAATPSEVVGNVSLRLKPNERVQISISHLSSPGAVNIQVSKVVHVLPDQAQAPRMVQHRATSFFRYFTNFKHDPNADWAVEFDRLAATCGWKRGSDRYNMQRAECMRCCSEPDADKVDSDNSKSLSLSKVSLGSTGDQTIKDDEEGREGNEDNALTVYGTDSDVHEQVKPTDLEEAASNVVSLGKSEQEIVAGDHTTSTSYSSEDDGDDDDDDEENDEAQIEIINYLKNVHFDDR